MTNIKKTVTMCAAAVVVAVGTIAVAQDDLDDLLKDLDAKPQEPAKPQQPAAKPASAPEVKPAPVPEVKPAGKPAEEVKPAPKPAADEKPVEKPVEDVKPAEKPAEEVKPAAEVKPVAKKPAAKPSTEQDALLADLDKEDVKPAPKPAADEKPAEKPAEDVKPTEKPAEEAKPAEASAETKPEEKPAEPAVKLSPEDAALIAEMRATEQVRREAMDREAKRELEEARDAMMVKRYEEAVQHYRLAKKYLNDRPETKPLRLECEQGIAEGLYRAALLEYDVGVREKAMKLMGEAVEVRHPKARKQLETWKAADDPDADKKRIADVMHERNHENYQQERAEIRRRLRRASQLYSLRKIKDALEEVEIVLRKDEYNEEAIRLRKAIMEKKDFILKHEREATREGMIADVDLAWRPVYAVDARQLEWVSAATTKTPVGEDQEITQKQDILQRMRKMMLPSISFKPPATLIDAVDFFRQASKDYDRPEVPIEQRGFNFVLRTPETMTTKAAPEKKDDGGFGEDAKEESANREGGIPVIPTITASNISFYDALKLVCDTVEYKIQIKPPVVIIMHKSMSIEEMVSREYPVPDSLLERAQTAKDDLHSMGGSGFGGSSAKRQATQKNEDEGEKQDWKDLFALMGVEWPEGSSILYVKTLGKLFVKNTADNLEQFQIALNKLDNDKLIEIETRFVEVKQEDLNSLGFEWILNSNYDLGFGRRFGKALGLRQGQWTEIGTSATASTGSDATLVPITGGGGATTGSESLVDGSATAAETTAGGWTRVTKAMRADAIKNGTPLPRTRNVGINPIGGADSDMTTGMRYLSTMGNHVSGESYSTNDQFMRINAFLGNADLSMILHMLSQRSDTDLLSAPKVVTKSGENAVMKVVTEYIYPQDYDVQLQSSSSGGWGSSSSQSSILAVVEPQNFTMREVGVILDVTPTYSEQGGGKIDLELKPQVVDEPTWKNYGMKIPYSGNSSLQNFEGIGGIFTGLSSIFATLGTAIPDAFKQTLAASAMDSATTALDNLSNADDTMTYYDAPMEQPFFHVRSLEAKVAIYPGSTVVLGGLITEQRRAMDDKIPFLGDIPFLGRFFRSHSEQTIKRNLLIFVTARLLDPRGREIKSGESISKPEEKDENAVTAAPAAGN